MIKGLVVGIVLITIAFGLIHRDKGKWYEYIGAFIIGLFATFGLCLLSE